MNTASHEQRRIGGGHVLLVHCFGLVTMVLLIRHQMPVAAVGVVWLTEGWCFVASGRLESLSMKGSA